MLIFSKALRKLWLKFRTTKWYPAALPVTCIHATMVGRSLKLGKKYEVIIRSKRILLYLHATRCDYCIYMAMRIDVLLYSGSW